MSKTAQFEKNNKILMLAFDHRESFKKFINPNNPENVSNETAIQIKKDIIESTYPLFSGALLDADYGLPAYQLLSNNSKPFLLPIEKSGYETVNIDERQSSLEYSGEELKSLGALGIKLLIYINPNAGNFQNQLDIVKNAHEQTKSVELPFFLEIVRYDTKASVLDCVKLFLENDIRPDVYKLEAPSSIEEAKQVTELLQDLKWIVLTRGVSFEEFEKQLKMCVDGGCCGFLAGRSVWQEYPTLTDPEEKKYFLNETLPSRFKKISDIVLNS